MNKPSHLVDFSELGLAGIFHFVVTILGSVVLFWLLRWEMSEEAGEEAV